MPYWKKLDAKVEGASQRIQEDCMNFARIVESIGLQVIRAVMLLLHLFLFFGAFHQMLLFHGLKIYQVLWFGFL